MYVYMRNVHTRTMGVSSLLLRLITRGVGGVLGTALGFWVILTESLLTLGTIAVPRLALLIFALRSAILVKLRRLSVSHAISLAILGHAEIPSLFFCLISRGVCRILKTSFGGGVY